MKNKISLFSSFKWLGVCLFLLGFMAVNALAQATVAVRLVNPVYNCETQTYCLDVEFQSDMPNQELFGMNVRFFYDDAVMEFAGFQNFQGGYSDVTPGSSTIITANTGAFGFPVGNPTDFVNRAIQLTDLGAGAVILPNDGSWANLFQVCFSVSPNQDLTNFCPSVIWDLEVNPADGGFSMASDGVVMTLADQNDRNMSLPAVEQVVQYNWAYANTGTPTFFGSPNPVICIDETCEEEVIVDLPTMGQIRLVLFGLILMGTLLFLSFRMKNIF